LNQESVDECRPLIERIPNSYIRCGLTHWLEKHVGIAKTLGLHETGMPISSDTIESLFGVAKIHGTGEIKDANRIAPRIPVLCGKITRQDAENVLEISVKEQREWSCSSPSLTKRRRDVFSDSGGLEKIPTDDVNQNIELIVGSKPGQNAPFSNRKSVCYENHSEP
jgi:hypothetical protein